ncbi:uncharacterized protein E0L32_005142 [Thyridium curvatum]|uniref:Glycosyl transferase CAP10 domain-containing protein n=1 Tax=Thyridium curvatum TaxID=1093900 RepID=A0A507B4S2_9PEZI|nr:uncharacterized protein E0L32_005142 [Thyridium curvatum]TPX14747.1 hypothetical protein E0L32_005142 [Thyridium curvatum]
MAAFRQAGWKSVLSQSMLSSISMYLLRPPFERFNSTTIAIVGGAATICFLALDTAYVSLIELFEKPDLLARKRTVYTRPIAIICAITMPLLAVAYWAWICLDNTPHRFVDSLTTGALVATQWILLFQAARYESWDIAGPVGAFSAAAPTQEQTIRSVATAVKHLVAAGIALMQAVRVLPDARYKNFLWALILVPLISSAGQIGWDGSRLADDSGWLSGLPTYYGRHPIQDLVERSKATFQTKLEQQSQTLDQAVTEYRRRYHMEPPPGFDDWFKFAKEKKSLIIDNYDTIFDSVAPFLNLKPQSIRSFMEEAVAAGHIARCGFRGGKLEGDCGPRGETIQNMTAPYRHKLPDMSLLVNSRDEPTVLLPSTRAASDPMWQDLSGTHATNKVAEPCGSAWLQRSRSTFDNQSLAPLPLSLPFVQDARDSTDFCAHPEYADMHGMILAPLTLNAATKPAPILSQGKLSTFSDVLMPSQIYLQGYENLNDYGYADEEDPPWEEKQPKLYWIGSNNGGAQVDGSWRRMHRQRFVALAGGGADDADDAARTATYLAETAPGEWTPRRQRSLLPAAADVHFHAFRLCAWRECKAMMRRFRAAGRRPRAAQYAHRFLMDMDGLGYSGRFYAHLRSRSASFKMTVVREWHDDRLSPWVHYVPVSLSMAELPETVRFLQTDAGAQLAREIADRGREWWAVALRPEDFQVYFYRLLLELARVVDETRAVV